MPMGWRIALLLLLLSMPCMAQRSSFERLNGLVGKAYIDSANAVAYATVVGDLAGSMQVYTTALRYSDELGYAIGRAEALRWLAIVSYLQGQYDRSVAFNQQAIEAFRTLGLRAKEGDQYCSLGFQMKARDLPRAAAYMRKGIQMLEAEKDSGRLTAVYDNYGVIKLMANDSDSAAFYYGRALTLKRLFNDSLGIPFSLNKLGEIYLMRKDLPAAKRVFDEAFRIRNLRKDAFGIMENKACYGDHHLAATKADSAIVWYTRALERSRQQRYPFMERYCLDQLSKAYELAGDLSTALQMHRAFAAISDSLKNDQRTRQVTELELRFETLEKDRENSLLRQQRAEQQLAISRQRLWLVGLAGLTAAIVLIGLFLFQRHRQREAAKRDAAIIAEREKGLKAIILATEEERKRIAKDLHDGIVQSLTGISLRLQRKDGNDDTTRTTLGQTIAEVRTMSHTMMPRALAELGLVPSLSDMLEKSLGAAAIPYTFDQRGMEGARFDEATEIGTYRIAQELVNNIIKHAKATEVGVSIMRTASHLVLMVEDNGIGIPVGMAANEGMGLTNIRSRANALGGEVNMAPGPEKGTVVMVRVPLAASLGGVQ